MKFTYSIKIELNRIKRKDIFFGIDLIRRKDATRKNYIKIREWSYEKLDIVK